MIDMNSLKDAASKDNSTAGGAHVLRLLDEWENKYQAACLALEEAFIQFGRMGGNTTTPSPSQELLATHGSRDGWFACREALQKLGRIA